MIRILRCKSKTFRFAPFYLYIYKNPLLTKISERMYEMLTHQGTQTIQTERLILRRFKDGDAPQMFDHWAYDIRVAKFLSWEPHASVKETEIVIEKWMKRSESIDRYDWAIELDGCIIGSINIVGFSERDEWCELGYCLGYDYWNHGYMTEAVLAATDFLFSKVGFHRIMIRNATVNPASGRVAEKCGFRFEGIQRSYMKARSGGFYDMEMRALLREDWEKETAHFDSN